VLKVPQVLKVQLDLQEPRVQQVHKERWVLKVQQEARVHKVVRERKVLKRSRFSRRSRGAR
jgi:hypothetical protein